MGLDRKQSQRQLPDEDASLVAIQGSELSQDGVWALDCWTVLSATALGGEGGCQMSLAVADASYRHMFATLSGKWRADVCMLYAPRMLHAEVVREAWWSDILCRITPPG